MHRVGLFASKEGDMQSLAPLTTVGKGHVERIGKDMYLACIKDNHNNSYELMELDPHAAQQAAVDFCVRNGIALQIFSVSEEVQRAHLNDIGDFLAAHEGERVRPEYVPGLKKAV